MEGSVSCHSSMCLPHFPNPFLISFGVLCLWQLRSPQTLRYPLTLSPNTYTTTIYALNLLQSLFVPTKESFMWNFTCTRFGLGDRYLRSLSVLIDWSSLRLPPSVLKKGESVTLRKSVRFQGWRIYQCSNIIVYMCYNGLHCRNF